MSFLDKVKGLVTEQVEVPDEPIKLPKTTSVVPSVISTLNFPTQNYSGIGTADTVEIDKSIKAKFDEALAINTPPLYTELNDTVAMLAEDIPNVASRYKAAIKLLTKRGATASAIIAAFDQCIQIIEKKAQEFQVTAAKKLEEKVGSKKSAIDGLDKSINDTNMQIAALNAQIQSYQSQIQTFTTNKANLQTEMAKDEEQIKLKQSRLEIIYKELHDDFDKKKQSLLDYIK